MGFRLEHDALPEATPGLPSIPGTESGLSNNACTGATTNASLQPRRRWTRRPYRTEPDIFGRYRVYSERPLTIPDSDAPPAPILPAADKAATDTSIRSIEEIIHPCPNISTFYVQRHHWLGGGSKSLDDRNRLCNEVLFQPDFKPSDLVGINLAALDDKLAAAANCWDTMSPPSEGWKNASVQLQIPPLRQTKASSKLGGLLSAEHYVSVSGLRLRKLTEVMRRAFASNDLQTFHYEPYELYWQSPQSPTTSSQRIHGEIYSSPAMIQAHREVQQLKISDSGCILPRCVAAFMFSSDGLQFGNFCHAKAWPIYAFFGNVSKYERCKPNSNVCYPVAHVPMLPDRVKEEIAMLHGRKAPPAALLTHLRRELMHEVWIHLLDNDFIQAWSHGIVIKCADGITRRVFPRILTYSADYPEKVLLATIRNNGDCPCPRCLMKKSSASQIGTPADGRVRIVKRRRDNKKRHENISQARKHILELGKAVRSKDVEDLLRDESYVPTQNAFLRRLGLFKFDIFSTLVVDQLHEIELGVWKSLFEHLIRLLHLNGSTSVTEFNRRFRSVPTFGSTIRLFSDDVASMSRIAACDFEDILQCCIPVFEGLLPPQCDEPARQLIFVLAQWHGLAKLRLHTGATIKAMKTLTITLGSKLRDFAELTNSLDIRETPNELARRMKQSETAKAKSARAPNQKKRKNNKVTKGKSVEKGTRSVAQKRTLNLNTYKTHAIGDYTSTIEHFGTTDSYSTQIGELQHRNIKRQYARTNKKDALDQMTRIGDITDVLVAMDKELSELETKLQNMPLSSPEAVQSLVDGSSYYIGLKERTEDAILSVAKWADCHRHDDAIKFFIPQLKRHFLARILGGYDHPAYNEQELGRIQFHRGPMYQHKTLRINYTSYDVLRQQDVLNPSTLQCFVMLPAVVESGSESTSSHPFVYGKVLGVYHAGVLYQDQLPRRMDFIHVRWLYYDYSCPGGWDQYRLDRISYETCRTDQDILDSFDFVDPNDVIRATHLLPNFNRGDWQSYYVNRFVDCDMLMRYIGGAVGHFKQNANPQPAGISNATDTEVAMDDLDEEMQTTEELGIEEGSDEEEEAGERTQRPETCSEGPPEGESEETEDREGSNDEDENSEEEEEDANTDPEAEVEMLEDADFQPEYQNDDDDISGF